MEKEENLQKLDSMNQWHEMKIELQPFHTL